MDIEEPHIQTVDCKLYVDFQWHRGQELLTPVLFKGQLYFVKDCNVCKMLLCDQNKTSVFLF